MCLQGGEAGSLEVVRQLVGNNDEVTDLRFVGPAATPTHLAVATNSPDIRLFDTVGQAWRPVDAAVAVDCARLCTDSVPAMHLHLMQ